MPSASGRTLREMIPSTSLRFTGSIPLQRTHHGVRGGVKLGDMARLKQQGQDPSGLPVTNKSQVKRCIFPVLVL
nr:hypothetical protein [Zhaonella formicivorans]